MGVKFPVSARRAAAAAVAVLAIAAAVLPFVDLPALAPALRAALSRAVGRPVEFSGVRCSLLPVPALLAGSVVIAEDPAFGLEPFIYADELRASVRLAPLLRGAVEVDAISLSGASLNIARDESAGFNVAAFLRKSLAISSDPERVPEIVLRKSRINFRSGSLKSVYYFNAVDLDLEPPRRPGGELRWRYDASPARTDRAEQGFGRFTGTGRWIPGPSGGRFAIDVSLEQSAVSELLVLLTGRDLGLQGRFVARAFLDGPFDGLALKGRLELQDLERQALFDFRSAGMQLALQGRLDLDRQTLDLTSAPPARGRQALPLSLRLEGRGLFTAPGWRAELGFEQIPAAGLLAFTRRLGLAAPADFQVEGAVSGSASFATREPARGRLLAPSVGLRLAEGPPVQAAGASLLLEGDRLTLESARIVSPRGSEASVTGSWDWSSARLAFEVRTAAMDIAELNGALHLLAPLPPVPFLDSCTAGQWRGRLAFTQESPEDGAAAVPVWSGQAALAGARCAPPWLPGPLRLKKALLESHGAAWRLRDAEVEWGGGALHLQIRHDPGRRPPLEVSIQARRLSGEDMESVFRAAQPSRRSLLDRTLRRRAAMPAWLRQLDIAGVARTDTLVLGRQEFDNVEARFHWRRDRIRLHSLNGQWKGAAVSGAGSADLWREEPLYSVRAAVTGLGAGSAVFDAELEAVASTLGPGLAEKTRGWAQVSAPLLRLPGGAARQLHVSLEYDGSRPAQPWSLPEISFWLEGQFWTGRGGASPEGALRAEFPASAAQWDGSLWPPALTRTGR